MTVPIRADRGHLHRPRADIEVGRWGVDRSVDAIRDKFGRAAVGYATSVLSGADRVPDEFRELAERGRAGVRSGRLDARNHNWGMTSSENRARLSRHSSGIHRRGHAEPCRASLQVTAQSVDDLVDAGAHIRYAAGHHHDLQAAHITLGSCCKTSVCTRALDAGGPASFPCLHASGEFLLVGSKVVIVHRLEGQGVPDVAELCDPPHGIAGAPTDPERHVRTFGRTWA